MRIVLYASVVLLAAGALAVAQVGYVDFDGTEDGLIGYTNPVVTYTGPPYGTDAQDVSLYGTTTWSAGDAFWPMSRDYLGPNGYGMPYGISDDSVEGAEGNDPYTSDSQGFAGMAYDGNGFFGVCDTENSENSGPVVATFDFDIDGYEGLGVRIDFAAMGDFEAAGDFFVFDYAIDGGDWLPLFSASVNEDISQTYYMDNPDNNPVVIDDPLFMNGVILDDNMQTLEAEVTGTGAVLTIRFSAQTDGGSEGFGFDNMRVVPEPATLVLLGLGGLALLRRRR